MCLPYLNHSYNKKDCHILHRNGNSINYSAHLGRGEFPNLKKKDHLPGEGANETTLEITGKDGEFCLVAEKKVAII